MFGNKQREIERLNRDIESWASIGRVNDKIAEDLRAELSKIAQINRGIEAKIAGLEKDVLFSDSHIETLEYALSESKGMNQALEDENRDLVRQLELLRAVLAQVRVNVTLPARKRS